MNVSQYLKAEKAISAAENDNIRRRWLWGLRILRDPDAFTPGSTQLKPGRAELLVKAYKAAGVKLSAREIQYRLRAARAYGTESEIAQASAEFETWSALIAADFPPFEAPADEPPADHRTDVERDRDRARALLDLIGEQGSLFPLADFEPITTPLKDLVTYAEQMAELTARFAERDRKRFAYLDRLREAVDYDLSVTWHAAHQRLVALNAATGEEPVPELPQQRAA